MMTSVGGSRARSNWEQTQGQTQSQSQHKQRPQVNSPSQTDAIQNLKWDHENEQMSSTPLSSSLSFLTLLATRAGHSEKISKEMESQVVLILCVCPSVSERASKWGRLGDRESKQESAVLHASASIECRLLSDFNKKKA